MRLANVAPIQLDIMQNFRKFIFNIDNVVCTETFTIFMLLVAGN
jgi:ribosomal protein S3AE